jgi:hypothetical protein
MHPLRLAIGMLIVLATVATAFVGVAVNTDETTPDSMIVLTGWWAILGAIVVVLRPRHPIGQIARYRSAGVAERQQLKLVALAAPVAVVCALLGGLTDGTPFESFFWGIAVLAVPVAVAVAILRYRLFDVDRLISRTLVYGVVTVLLGAAYAGLVLGGQALFSSFAGGSNLAIAASTLVVAALFLPVRSRVQWLVDRRFYRRRYDARRTLEAFGARLREQVELESLQADLEHVVAETMQPAHVSLWVATQSHHRGSPVTIP